MNAEWYLTISDRRRGLRTRGWARSIGTIIGSRWSSLFGIGGIREHLRYVTGYHPKKTYLPCQTSHSPVARQTSVGSLEIAGVGLGSHTHYEAHFEMELEFGNCPVDLSNPLQRQFEGE